MKPRRLALIVGLFLFLAGGNADAGDAIPLPSPHVRLTSGPGTLLAPNGVTYNLPVGTHILDEDTFLTVEREMKRLQEQETRLKAENKSLREDTGGVGWGTILIVTLGAVALGFTANHFAQ